jgi:hypothetical protein
VIGSREHFVLEVPAVEVADRGFGRSTITACGIRRLTLRQRGRTGSARWTPQPGTPPSSKDPGAAALSWAKA